MHSIFFAVLLITVNNTKEVSNTPSSILVQLVDFYGDYGEGVFILDLLSYSSLKAGGN